MSLASQVSDLMITTGNVVAIQLIAVEIFQSDSSVRRDTEPLVQPRNGRIPIWVLAERPQFTELLLCRHSDSAGMTTHTLAHAWKR